MTTQPRNMDLEKRHRGVMTGLGLLLFTLFCNTTPSPASGLTLGQRLKVTHPGTGHAAHLSGAAIAATRDGGVVLAWTAPQGEAYHVYVTRPGRPAVRVNPEGLTAESLHQSPGLAVGPGDEIYVSWSANKPRPEGTLFASDLYLSRSLDGGQHFDTPLRVNEDRPISHAFEGLAVAADGTVMVAWIDSREGWEQSGTYLARVGERGNRVEQVVQLDKDTCVCCRVYVATAPKETVAVTWRKVFPGNIRDMVLGLSRDGGRTWGPIQTLSQAIKAYAPDVAVLSTGGFAVVWHEEQFPLTKTVVQPIRLDHTP